MKALPLILALAVTTPVAAEETPEPAPSTEAEAPSADDGDGEASDDAEQPAYDAEAACTAEFSPKWSLEVGGAMGNPMGLDLKYFFIEAIAIKALLGTTFSKDLMGSLDLLFLHYPVLEKDPFNLHFSVGVGGIIGGQDYYDEFTTAVGLPLALDMPLEKSAWTISLLLRPGVTLVPDYAFSFSWNLGIRYNFDHGEYLEARERCFIDNANGYFAELTDTEGQLAETQNDLGETRKDLSETATKLSHTEKELAAKAAEIEVKEQDLAKIKEEREEQKKALEKAEEELKKNEEHRTELENRVAAMKNNIEKSADPEEVAALKKQLAELQSETEELQGDISNQRRDKCVASGGTFEGDTCNCPDGRVSKNDVCVCPQAREVWLASKKNCICSKGYYRHKETQKCTPCRYLKSNGYCRWTACTDQERRQKVDTRDGVDVYTCANRCSNENEIWSSRSETCICAEGYKRVGATCQSRN